MSLIGVGKSKGKSGWWGKIKTMDVLISRYPFGEEYDEAADSIRFECKKESELVI